MSDDVGGSGEMPLGVEDSGESFPIRELSMRTAVNTVTLRAWERRYGLLKPLRTPKGHRLYVAKDVERVKRVLSLVAQGIPVSKVKPYLDQGEGLAPQAMESSWAKLRSELQQAAQRFSVDAVEKVVSDSFLNYPVSVCWESLLEPLFKGLQADTSTLAEYLFLQSELVRYAQQRVGVSNKQAFREEIVLLCGSSAPMWRLAVMAMALGDSGHRVSFLGQPCELEGWLAIVSVITSGCCIVYEEGVWREYDLLRVEAAVPKCGRLLFCGSAAQISGLSERHQVFDSPQRLVSALG